MHVHTSAPLQSTAERRLDTANRVRIDAACCCAHATEKRMHVRSVIRFAL